MSARSALPPVLVLLLAALPAQDPLQRLARMPVQAAPSPALAVRVLQADGKPAADVQLYAIELPPKRQLPIDAWPQDDLRWHAIFALEQGRHYAVDRDGNAAVPAGKALKVYAFAGTLFGRADIAADAAPGAAPVAITLAAPVTVTAVVRTADGAPAADLRLLLHRDNAQQPTARITDAAGCTTVQLLPAGERRQPAVLRVLLPLATPVQATLEPGSAAPVELRLPPCGGVRVVARNVPLTISSRTEYRLAFGPPEARMLLEAEREENSILFPRVGPGVPVTLVATVPGIEGEFTLPVDEVKAGIDTFVVFDLEQQPWCALQLCLPDGAPIGRASLAMSVVPAGGAAAPAPRTLRTDTKGQARFVLPPECAHGAGLKLVRGAAEGQAELSVGIPGDKLGGGKVELGQVRLEAH